jgi:hypothetical protein
MAKETVNIAIPKVLKRIFEATCTHHDIDVSEMASLLIEQWCISNNKTTTIAQLIAENRSAAEGANLSDINLIADGGQPTKADLVKLATALGIRVELLIAIADRTH